MMHRLNWAFQTPYVAAGPKSTRYATRSDVCISVSRNDDNVKLDEVFTGRRLLFVVRNQFFPESDGGAQRSNLALLRWLVGKGMCVEGVCLRETRGTAAIVDALLNAVSLPVWRKDIRAGFVTHRLSKSKGDWIPFVQVVAERFRPHVVFVQLTRRTQEEEVPVLSRLRVPLICFVREADHIVGAKHLSLYGPGCFAANSPFIADLLEARTTEPVHVLLPSVEAASYRVKRQAADRVTFVTMVERKGVQTALAIARLLPDIPFLFVQGRRSGQVSRQQVRRYSAEAAELPNVDVFPYERDMRSVYARTRLLIVPSQFDEPFCRVILESHVNGIPVVAARRGGIPYTLGKGGILIDLPDTAPDYAAAVKKIWSDKSLYKELSRAAHANARRQEFDCEGQLRAFGTVIESLLTCADQAKGAQAT